MHASSASTIGASIAAIVVTFDRLAPLERTLRSLLSQTRPPEHIFIVNNGRPLPRRAFDIDTVEIIEVGDNLGYAGGLAHGVEKAGNAFGSFLFCDDDTTAQPDLLERLATVLSIDSDVGVVGTAGGQLRLGTPRHGHFRHSRVTHVGTLHDVDFCLVDHALVRAEALRLAKPPDPDLFIMLEDVDFTDRVRRAGYRVCVLEVGVAREHLGSIAPWRLYYQTRNQALIARKHRSPVLWLGWGLRTVKLTMGAAVVSRDLRKVRARLKGALDGLRGRVGRSVDPSDPRYL